VTDPKKAGQLVDEGFVPIISEIPGFVAYYWVDAGDGVMVSTSIFEDRSGEEESNWRAGESWGSIYLPCSRTHPISQPARSSRTRQPRL
jgi:hypothetical protein